MEKQLFGNQGLVRTCPQDHYPVMPQSASPLPRYLWVRSSPSLSLAGWGTGGEKEVELFWENQTAGQEKPQPQHSHPWPLATSVILMVHIWFHRGETQAAVLAKQTAQPQDFALRSLGVIPRL